jgi:hypothetical protein
VFSFLQLRFQVTLFALSLYDIMHAFPLVLVLVLSQLLLLGTAPVSAKLNQKSTSHMRSVAEPYIPADAVSRHPAGLLDVPSPVAAPSPSYPVFGHGPAPRELHQHHERRALLDVCAYIDTSKLLGGNVLGIPVSDLLDLKICLCLSALPLAIDANVQLKALADKFGRDLINLVLNTLVR